MTGPSDGAGASTPGSAAGGGRAPLLRLARRVGQRLGGWPRTAGVALTVAWALLIWSSSARTGSQVPMFPGSTFVANLAHAPLFGLLALWATLTLPRADGWPRLDRRTLPLVAGAVALWAVVDEWHQAHVPGRDVSLWDLGTDAVGALATLAVIHWVGRADADERGLRRRLGWGLAACLAAAALSTWA